MRSSGPDPSASLPASLPPSLDAYYPPRAAQPVYLFQMFALGTSLTGVISDLLAGDVLNAEKNLAAFKALYASISDLVPEWKSLFPAEPLAAAEKAFQAATQAKDPGPFMAAVEKIGSVCGTCHHAYMAPVQQKYHWKSFHGITIKDPASGRVIGFTELMQALNLGFAGSWIDATQGQPENAQARFQQFNGVFQALKSTCGECHGTSERKYYVDADTQALIDAYGKILAEGGDLKKAEAAMMAVGEEACFKCHLVHVPAAFSKQR